MSPESALGHLPQQVSLLRRALDYFRDDDRVEALVLSGSLAHGAPDQWSDVDLYVVSSEQHFAEVFDERTTAASALGPLLAQFTVHGVAGGSSDQIALYDDLVKLDLMYYRPSEIEPHRKWSHALILKDTRGSLRQIQQRSRRLESAVLPDDHLLRLDQQFWVWCWYSFGKIERGEHWEALDALHEIRSSAVVPLLLAVAEEHSEGYRRLESTSIGPAGALARTVASLDSESQHEALRQEIALFVTARDSLFARRGLLVNHMAEAAIRAAVASR